VTRRDDRAAEALAEVVEAACRRRGIPHRTRPTLRSAISAHHALLRELGRPHPAVGRRGECPALSPLAT